MIKRTKKILINILLKNFLRLDNFIYQIVSSLATKLENGLHPKHRLMNYHNFFIANINNNDTILDIGCGNGSLAYDLAKKAKKITAIDLNEKNIAKAKKNYSSENIEYIIGDAISYEFTERFDVVILSNVLEHIKQRIEFLRKIKHLAPKILIRVPMINRDWITLYKKELRIEWRLDKTHDVEYTLENFQKELSTANLYLKNYSVQFGEIWAVVQN